MKKTFIFLFLIALAISFSACSSDDSSSGSGTPGTYFTIEGTITHNSAGLSHVSVELSGDARNSAITDDNGNYTFSYVTNGDYTVTPLPSGYTFDHTNITVTVNNANVADTDFVATKIDGAADYLHYTFPDQTDFLDNYPGSTVDDEAGILFADYTLTDNILYDDTPTYVSGYALDQFVDEDTVNAVTPDPGDKLGDSDARKLYSVVVVSNNDGYSNRSKFFGDEPKYNADLTWDQYIQGFLLDLNYSAKVFFPEAVGLTKMFNNKYSYDIIMFRKIDVIRPDTAGTTATFEVGATTDSYVDDTDYTAYTTLTTTKFTVDTISFTSNSGNYTNVKAISLDQFLTPYVVEDPTDVNLTYDIVAVDDFEREDWTYTEMQQAYYLIDYDLICQVSGGAQVSQTKINFPVKIEIVTTDPATIAAADTYYDDDTGYGVDYQNPPAYAVYE